MRIEVSIIDKKEYKEIIELLKEILTDSNIDKDIRENYKAKLFNIFSKE